MSCTMRRLHRPSRPRSPHPSKHRSPRRLHCPHLALPKQGALILLAACAGQDSGRVPGNRAGDVPGQISADVPLLGQSEQAIIGGLVAGHPSLDHTGTLVPASTRETSRRIRSSMLVTSPLRR